MTPSRKQRPGSQNIFPEVIRAAEKIADEFNLQIVTACSSNIDEDIFSKITNTKEFENHKR